MNMTMIIAQPWRVNRQLYALNLSAFLAYRGSMLIYLLESMVRPLIGLTVWRASLSAGADLPRDAQFVTTWFVLLPVVNLLTSSWLAGFLSDEIRTGSLAGALMSPIPVWRRWVTSTLAEKSLDAVMLLPMLLVLVVLFRGTLSLTGNPALWMAFAVSVIGAAMLTFALELAIGSLAFWMDTIGSINQAKTMLAGVLGGQLVPLAFFPEGLQGVLVVQPFRYMFAFPLEILTGDVTGGALVLGFLIQAAWLAVTFLLARTLWRRGLRHYSAPGI